MEDNLTAKMTIAEMELGVQKTCTRCGESWPADTEFFQRCRSNPDGLDKICKCCRKQVSLTAKRHYRERQESARRRRVETKHRLAHTIVHQGEI